MTARPNGYGSFRTTLTADMAAHDACPPPLRDICNYAVASYSSEILLRAYENARQVGFDDTELIRAVRASIRRSDDADTARTYGPNHPEAR